MRSSAQGSFRQSRLILLEKLREDCTPTAACCHDRVLGNGGIPVWTLALHHSLALAADAVFFVL
jgi:hypothetical protein